MGMDGLHASSLLARSRDDGFELGYLLWVSDPLNV